MKRFYALALALVLVLALGGVSSANLATGSSDVTVTIAEYAEIDIDDFNLNVTVGADSSESQTWTLQANTGTSVLFVSAGFGNLLDSYISYELADGTSTWSLLPGGSATLTIPTPGSFSGTATVLFDGVGFGNDFWWTVPAAGYSDTVTVTVSAL